jgi:hypothetical protein
MRVDEIKQPKRTKFQDYLDRLNTRPFLMLLASKQRVTEADAMRAYGFTPETKSWPGKIANIASKARRELQGHGIVLPRASRGRGWSLDSQDREKAKRLISAG